MRLFTGLELSGDVAGNLAELLRRLKPAARIHWSPPENLRDDAWLATVRSGHTDQNDLRRWQRRFCFTYL